jgi:hypothetical protein
LVNGQSHLSLRKAIFFLANEVPTQGLPKILADVRDYDEDVKTGVPTIPVLLKSSLKTWMVLTAVQGAVMIAFLHNTFIVGNCCFTIALAWILGKDAPKVYFRLSLHSQSILIVMYAVMSIFSRAPLYILGLEVSWKMYVNIRCYVRCTIQICKSLQSHHMTIRSSKSRYQFTGLRGLKQRPVGNTGRLPRLSFPRSLLEHVLESRPKAARG